MEKNQNFTIGQIFENDYPEAAAVWCNKNQKAYIKEIEPVIREVEEWFETPAAYDDDGNEIPESASSWSETIEKEVRRFQIISIPEPTQEEIEDALQKRYTQLVQNILDKEAYALGYTGPDESINGACMSVCSYVDTGVQKFDDEGKAFRAWRSAVWAKGYELLAEVKSGARAIPTSDELIQLLPSLEIIYTTT